MGFIKAGAEALGGTMAEIKEYKCPFCGGAITFGNTIQKMKCPFCDTEFEMGEIANYESKLENEFSDMNWDNYNGEELQADRLRSYVCKSCGGEIVGDENTAVTSCPFCGKPVIMTAKFPGMLRPDCVIPFKFDKSAAKAALKKHYEGKRLLPKVFKDQNHIDEVKGIYVPFWLFDAEAEADMRYKATKLRAWSDNRYDYTETSFYSVTRGGNIGFEKVPVDVSEKMADDLMEALEPFDFAAVVDFKAAYLAGFFADKYDMDAKQSIQRANECIKKSVKEAFDATVQGYETVTNETCSIRLKDGSVKYALLPVWLLSTSWNGKNYLFAMNGQSGKMVGDLPLDKEAYGKWLFGLTGIIGAMTFAAFYLMCMFAALPKAPFPVFAALMTSVGVGFVIALISTSIMKMQLRSVRSQAAADSYIKSGSMQVTKTNDLFLYRLVDRREKPRENNSGISGGSRTHTSSSGRSRGGRGGKF